MSITPTIKQLLATCRQSQHSVVQFSAGLGIALLLIPATVYADGAFRWIGADGKTHFGSNPPADAKQVTSLGGKSFSRYSSARAIGKDPSTRASLGNEPAPTVAPKPSRSARIQEVDLTVAPFGALNPPQGQILKRGRLTIERNATLQVTKCSVMVKNPGHEPANNIRVNFEFEDGTLVPARGPDLLRPRSEAAYEIPKNQLPLEIASMSPDAVQDPRVLIENGEVKANTGKSDTGKSDTGVAESVSPTTPPTP